MFRTDPTTLVCVYIDARCAIFNFYLNVFRISNNLDSRTMHVCLNSILGVEKSEVRPLSTIKIKTDFNHLSFHNDAKYLTRVSNL